MASVWPRLSFQIGESCEGAILEKPGADSRISLLGGMKKRNGPSQNASQFLLGSSRPFTLDRVVQFPGGEPSLADASCEGGATHR